MHNDQVSLKIIVKRYSHDNFSCLQKSGNGSFKPNVRYMVTATDSMYRPPNGHPVLGGVPAPGAVGPHGVIGFNSLPMAPGAMIETQLLQVPLHFFGLNFEGRVFFVNSPYAYTMNPLFG